MYRVLTFYPLLCNILESINLYIKNRKTEKTWQQKKITGQAREVMVNGQ